MSAIPTCAACGSEPLQARLRVAGEAGERGLAPDTDRFGVALADIYGCQRCGHMQLVPMPTEARLADAYAATASDVYINEERGQRATASAVLSRIERHTEPGRMLDLGCWVGFLLDGARGRGWEVAGVEPSRFAADYARQRLGLAVESAGLLEADLDPGFTAVTMLDVLEHLPEPGRALSRVHGLLDPEGVITLALPDAGSRVARAMGRRWWSVIPTHLHYFSRASIAALLERGGFEIVEVSTAPKTFTVGYYLERIRGYSTSLGSALLALASRAGISDRLWAPDFRDRMLVIARRRT